MAIQYELSVELHDDTNPEGIAQVLERAAEQVRSMSSTRAAHSMQITRKGAAISGEHGVCYDLPARPPANWHPDYKGK